MANRKYKERNKIVIELESFTQEDKEKLISIRQEWDEYDRDNNRIVQ